MPSPWVLLIWSGVTATAAAQQPYPAKPIRVIVPFGPGGPGDFLVRTVKELIALARAAG